MYANILAEYDAIIMVNQKNVSRYVGTTTWEFVTMTTPWLMLRRLNNDPPLPPRHTQIQTIIPRGRVPQAPHVPVQTVWAVGVPLVEVRRLVDGQRGDLTEIIFCS